MLVRTFRATSLLAILAILALAQQPIRVQVNEVIVPVTVTDEKGKFVSNLDKEDFHVFDQGKEQVIRYFNRERSQPVVVGFLVDLSTNSKSQWKQYQEAIIELVYNLLPEDKKFSGYLISYSNEAELRVNTTNDPDKIVDEVRKLTPGGGAALNDAIYIACTNRKLVNGEPVEPRRIIIVLGDGHDNASSHTLDEVLELAQRNLVTVYAVSTDAYGFTSDSRKNLVKLAEETGGRVEDPLMNVYNDVSGFLSQPSDFGNYQLKVGTGGYATQIAQSIFRSITAIAGEITTQYILRYVPDTDASDDPRVRRNIEVKVGIPTLQVRARTHYYPRNP